MLSKNHIVIIFSLLVFSRVVAAEQPKTIHFLELSTGIDNYAWLNAARFNVNKFMVVGIGYYYANSEMYRHVLTAGSIDFDFFLGYNYKKDRPSRTYVTSRYYTKKEEYKTVVLKSRYFRLNLGRYFHILPNLGLKAQGGLGKLLTKEFLPKYYYFSDLPHASNIEYNVEVSLFYRFNFVGKKSNNWDVNSETFHSY